MCTSEDIHACLITCTVLDDVTRRVSSQHIPFLIFSLIMIVCPKILILDHLGCIEYLLEKGANVEAKDFAGHTHLFFCTGMMSNDLTLNIAKLLVKAGANVNAVNRMGSSPLFEATMDRKVKSVDFLLVNKLVWQLDISKQMKIIENQLKTCGLLRLGVALACVSIEIL